MSKKDLKGLSNPSQDGGPVDFSKNLRASLFNDDLSYEITYSHRKRELPFLALNAGLIFY
jgi:hypothetical protein